MENAKSVIDIEVNDDQFKRFHDLFNQYQEQLGKMSGAWSDASDGIKAATGDIKDQADTQEASDKSHMAAMKDFTAAIIAHNQLLNEGAQAERRQDKEKLEALKKQKAEVKSTNDLYKSRVKAIKDFSGTLSGMIGSTATIGLNIAKWGIGLGVGLLGGGFYGMERLGGSATEDRMRAHGLGVSSGELRAWQTDVGSYIDPSNLLGTASNAYADPRQRALLQRAGASAETIRSGNTSQISEQALHGLIEFYNRNQGPNATQAWTARGFDQLLSFGDIRRIASIPAAEQARMFANLRRDTSGLNNSDQNLAAWQDFYTSLKRSGQVLKTTFLDGLVDLSGPIKELSGSLVDLVREFMHGGGFKATIGILSHGLRDLSDSMRDGTFKKGVEDFSSALKKFASSGQMMQDLATLERVLHIVAVIADKTIGTVSKSPFFGGSGWSGEKPVDDGKGNIKWVDDPSVPRYGFGDAWSLIKQTFGASSAHAATIDQKNPNPVTDNSDSARQEYKAPYDTNYWTNKEIPHIPVTDLPSIPKEINNANTGQSINIDNWEEKKNPYLDAIMETESGGNPNAVSSKGATGAYQMMPATAAYYGVKNLRDPAEEREGAGRYIDALRRMFNNDMVKATAAYNAGQGRVGNAVSRYGSDWLSHMPRETQDYVGRVAKNYETASHVNIQINNSTGGAATVTAAQAFR